MILSVVFIGLLLLGVPVAFVLLGSSIAFALDFGRISVMGAFPATFYAGLDNFELLSIPFFILLGEIMSVGGLTRMLFQAGSRLLGRIPRKLAIVVVLSNAFLASILGSANAQVAVMSRVCVPELERENYTRPFAAALTAGASLLGPIIPPSMVFIIYAVIAQVSIGDMFIAGIVPGLLLTALIGVVIVFSKAYGPEGHKPMPAPEARAQWMPMLGTLLIPVLIISSILGGVATPTESAAVAVVIALAVVWLFFEPIPSSRLWAILINTALNSTIVFMLIASAKVFGFILAYYRVPQAATEVLTQLSSGPISFLLLVVLLLLFIGAVMDGMAAIIILVPILLPVAVDAYGISPITFGVIFCMTVVIGLITPPVGSVLYIAAAISNVSVGKLTYAIIPFVLAAVVVVIALVLFPVLTTVLL